MVLVRGLLYPPPVRLWERANQELTGSRWPWERWYSEPVSFFHLRKIAFRLHWPWERWYSESRKAFFFPRPPPALTPSSHLRRVAVRHAHPRPESRPFDTVTATTETAPPTTDHR